jgi:hypothetical protein
MKFICYCSNTGKTTLHHKQFAVSETCLSRLMNIGRPSCIFITHISILPCKMANFTFMPKCHESQAQIVFINEPQIQNVICGLEQSCLLFFHSQMTSSEGIGKNMHHTSTEKILMTTNFYIFIHIEKILLSLL